MSAKSDGVGFSHQGLGRRVSAGQSVPTKPYPMTVVYSAYVDNAPNDTYQTFFAFGPESFTSSDYYTTAIVAGTNPPKMSVGAAGSDVNTGSAVPTGRWMRHGFQAFTNAAATERTHRFYYDLPRLDFVEIGSGGAGASYFSAPTSDAYIRINDVWWAIAETLDGRTAGFKMWTTVLTPQAMAIEAQSPFPVIEKYRAALWCCIPLRTATDTFDVSGNGRHFYPGTGGSAPNTRANPPYFILPRNRSRRTAFGIPGPSITAQPQNQTVYTDQTANFTITATGTGTLHYQWKDDGSNVGTDSSSYTTGAATPSDNGSLITCVVTDDIGSTASDAALLTVIATAHLSWIAA